MRLSTSASRIALSAAGLALSSLGPIARVAAPALVLAALVVAPAIAQNSEDDDEDADDANDDDAEFDGGDDGDSDDGAGGGDDFGDDAGDDTGDDAGGDAGDDDGPGGNDDGPGDDDAGGGALGRSDGDDDSGRNDDDDDDDFGDDDSDDLGEQAFENLVGLSPDEYMLDGDGYPSRSREILALDLDADGLAVARDLGFQLAERKTLAGLNITMDRLRLPDGQDMLGAVDRLSRSVPAAPFDYNHIFILPEGETSDGPAAMSLRPIGLVGSGAGVRIGVIDTLPDRKHPALAKQKLVVKDFAKKGSRDTAHATAVTSILAGHDPESGYSGLVPGASVFAANIFTVDRDGQPITDAATMIEALDWLVGQNVDVINMSIAGPQSALLEEVIQRLQKRGTTVVAAVGNDGPAAPPLFPAAFKDVIGVTATDLDGNVYRRAGRGDHVDYSAPGVGLKAAVSGGRYGVVTGTSFATPVVAALVGLAKATEGASTTLAGEVNTRDLGAPGRDRIYGQGLVVIPMGKSAR